MERHYTLDAMRGIAGLAVVLFHYSGGAIALNLTSSSFAQSGYLAVDFFFLLSGYVISAVYGTRLLKYGRLDFGVIRLTRFYPLYFLGLVLGSIKPILKIVSHYDDRFGFYDFLCSFIPNLFMLPAPAEDLFPFTGTSWTLFLELLINAAFAVFIFRASKWILLVICFLAGISLITIDGGLNGGWTWSSMFSVGIPRVLFSFTLGVLISRFAIRQTFRPSIVSLLPVLVLGLLLIASVPTELRWAFDRVCVLIIFPALLIWGIRCEIPSQLTKLAAWMGESSFPIYAIHLPLLSLWATALASVGASYLRMTPVFMTICIGCSLLSSRMFDAPVRKWMNRMINRYLRSLRSTYRAREVPAHAGSDLP